MEVVLNGESRTLRHGVTVDALLKEMGLAGRRVAVELNTKIISKTEYASRVVAGGDRIEIVQFVGGG
jgi:sulfur carrier protein